MRIRDSIFSLVMLALSIEYVALPGGMSIFRIIVVPLCLLGLLASRHEPVRSETWATLAVLGCLLLLAFPAAAYSGDLTITSTAVGLSLFVLYMTLAVSRNGTRPLLYRCMATWGLPHVVILATDNLSLTHTGHDANAFRFDGLHNDPNLMGLFLLVAFAASIELYHERHSRLFRLVLVLYLLTLVYLIVLSASRGALLGLLVAIGLTAYRQFGRPALIAFLVLPLGLVRMIDIVGPSLLSVDTRNSPILHLLYRLTVLREASETTPAIISRWNIWKDAIHQVLSNPWYAGSGTRAFVDLYGHYPHNTILDAYLDLGVVGGTLFLLLVLLLISQLVIRSIHSPRNLQFEDCLLAAFLPATFFLSSFASKAYWVTLVLATVRLAQLLRMRTSSQMRPISLPPSAQGPIT